MKDTELKPCTNCGKMIQSDGTELCCSCYAKWKETLPEENAKLRTRIAELEAYRIDGVSLKTIKAVNESLRLRIAELEKRVEWHLFDIDNVDTYPPRTDMYLTLSIPERTEYREIDDGETYDVLWFELYSEEYWHKHNVTHWAYLPEPPREEG